VCLTVDWSFFSSGLHGTAFLASKYTFARCRYIAPPASPPEDSNGPVTFTWTASNFSLTSVNISGNQADIGGGMYESAISPLKNASYAILVANAIQFMLLRRWFSDFGISTSMLFQRRARSMTSRLRISTLQKTQQRRSAELLQVTTALAQCDVSRSILSALTLISTAMCFRHPLITRTL
jgi:hypothetical protein